MTTVLEFAALLCVAVGLVVGAIVVAVTRDVRIALGAAMDLWLASVLLRLSARPGWAELLAAASIIAIRQLVSRALRRSRRFHGDRLSPQGPRYAWRLPRR